MSGDTSSAPSKTVVTLCFKYNDFIGPPLLVNGKQQYEDEDYDVFDGIWYSLSDDLQKDLEEWSRGYHPDVSDALHVGGKPKDESTDPAVQAELDFLLTAQSLFGRLQEELKHENVVVELRVRPVRSIKLMNDYTVQWPLWYWADEETYRAYLDDDVKDRVEKWSQTFNGNFHYDTGWKSLQVRDQHREEGKRLVEILHEQLDRDPDIDWYVYLDLWE